MFYVLFYFFFFFKQKTAYEMRISDWSSDVCSSDLLARGGSVVLAAAMLAVTVSAAPAERATTHAPASRPLYTTQAPIAMLKDMDSGAILFERSEERRVGKECVSTCRSRWSP